MNYNFSELHSIADSFNKTQLYYIINISNYLIDYLNEKIKDHVVCFRN